MKRILLLLLVIFLTAPLPRLYSADSNGADSNGADSNGADRNSANRDGADRPNILLIVSDDQGYNDLGLLGNGIITPALDRLAKEGTRLTNFYVSWPACTPSRASLLTGRYPLRNGIYDMIRNEAPDYGHKYSPEEYDVTFERIGGMDQRVASRRRT